MIDAYPSPGEINRSIRDPSEAIDRVRANYRRMALSIDNTDGLSMNFGQWRFNLRESNTEPMVRLNVESRGNRDLMEKKKNEILTILDDT